MTYLYYNNDGLVKMRSEAKIQTELNHIKVNLTEEEQEGFQKNYMTWIRGKKIEFQKSKQAIKEEAIEKLKQKAKEDKIKLEDITELLINIL